MDSDDGWIRHRFAPGEEPTVYTAVICAEVGHEHCEGIVRTIEGYEDEAAFCTCWCQRRFVAIRAGHERQGSGDREPGSGNRK